MRKTTTLHVHHAFLYISLPVFARLHDVKMPNFSFYGVRKQATTKFYFSFFPEQCLVIEPLVIIVLVIISNPNHFNPKLTKTHCIIKSTCLPIAYLNP